MTLMCGVSTLIPQYLMAVYLGAELPAFAGSLVSLIVIVIMAKSRKEKQNQNFLLRFQEIALVHFHIPVGSCSGPAQSTS